MVRRNITKRLGQILLERGVITPQQLEQALAHQKAHGGLLGQVLIQLGFATEEEMALSLTAQYGFPYLPLENYEIDDGVVATVPEDFARQYCLVPVDRIGNALTLAMADPTNVQAIEEVERLTKCIVQAFVSTPSDIYKAIAKYYRSAQGAPPPATEKPKPSEGRRG